jgi:tetratricopeptide (TPR) repeat protein
MKKTSFIALLLLVISCNLLAQETPEELYNKAIEFKKNNNCAQALILLEKAIILKPNFGDAWLESGWCQNELNNHQAAIEKLEKAKTLLSNNYRINYELGHAYYFLDSVAFSLKYLKEAIRLKSDFQPSFVGLGDLYKDKIKNTAEALTWYLKAYAIDSTHKKTNYWIGWCYNDLEKFDKAIPFLEKVIAVDPGNTLAIIELGFSLYSVEKYDQAIDVLKNIAGVQPKPELVIYYTGLCHVRKGNKTEAVDSYNELVILNSKYALTLLSEIKKLK